MERADHSATAPATLPGSDPATALLRLQDAHFAYGEKPVLSGVSAALHPGEFVGVLGPNGSGKSTLLKLMSGLLAPRQGTCLLQGKNIQEHKRRELARLISWIPQEHHLPFPFSVLEVVLMGRHPYLPPLALEGESDYRIAQAAMQRVDVAALARRAFNEISGGEKQRVMIASAIAQEPQIMLLDEPISALDIKYQLEILDILRALNRERGMTLAVAMHDLRLAARYCSRLLLLDRGGIARDGTPASVLQKDILETVYGVRVRVTRDAGDIVVIAG